MLPQKRHKLFIFVFVGLILINLCRCTNRQAVDKAVPGALNNFEVMAIDIEQNILPLLYDEFMAAEELYHLLMNDMTVSANLKSELTKNYPYNNDINISNFISRVLLFTMNRTFIKHDVKTKELLSTGTLSPNVKDYIYDIVPKPCRHFCGRESNLEDIHELLKENDKIFLTGVAGIGKSELAKMYAEKYKKEYTNILYLRYGGNLKQMITDCDFADDTGTDADSRFVKHSRFLKSLKEDTLIIIDNFDIVPTPESGFDDIMQYRCKILFTTRCRFSEYTEFGVLEMPQSTLIGLAGKFYDKTEQKLEKLRSTMIYCRYVINFADKWKTAKTAEAARLKIHCDDYSEIIAELKSKISECKQKQDEKVKTPPIKIFRYKELTQAINELSEQIEELRIEKNTILANLNTKDIQTVKTKLNDIQKAVPAMERHSNESKTRLDSAQKEYYELKEQAQDFDVEELQNLRYDIRPQAESETISELQKIYGGSFIRNFYDTAKSETDKAIGEADRYSVRKRLENYINKKSVQKSENIRRKQEKENER